MHFEFDAKIDQAIHKSIRAALRLFKDQEEQAHESGTTTAPPSYETFMRTVKDTMEAFKQTELNKLRTPSLRDPFEHAWAQKLRNYATNEEIHAAYETLLRRYRRHSSS